MNTDTTYPALRHSERLWQRPPTTRQQQPHPHKKFTPASRHARISSWQQRMQTLFARQSY